MLSDPTRPVDAGDDSFWAAAAGGRLCFQRCTVCNTFRWPPCGVCASCYSWESDWVEVPGDGVIASYVVVHRSSHPDFPTGPYVVAFVEVAETAGKVCMLSNVVDCDPREVHVGMPVSVLFESGHDGRSSPKFRPPRGGSA